jgi:hypothetical protein
VLREFLRHNAFAGRCGLWLVSTPLTLEPVERFDYQHLEYAPLVNPRAHQVGPKRTILNARFREQYQRFLGVLSYKAKPGAADALAVAYYLVLQDRVGEALKWFARVDRQAVRSGSSATTSRRTSPSTRATWPRRASWRTNIRSRAWTAGATASRRCWTARRAGGQGGAAVDQEQRDQAQAALAASEPALELQVESGRIRLDTRNVKVCTLNFYPMDIELLFSRSHSSRRARRSSLSSVRRRAGRSMSRRARRGDGGRA